MQFSRLSWLSHFRHSGHWNPIESFDAIQSFELIGSFEAVGSLELISSFEAVGPLEPIGSFEAKRSSKLVGSFGPFGSLEPIGSFEVNQSSDLVGLFLQKSNLTLDLVTQNSLSWQRHYKYHSTSSAVMGLLLLEWKGCSCCWSGSHIRVAWATWYQDLDAQFQKSVWFWLRLQTTSTVPMAIYCKTWTSLG